MNPEPKLPSPSDQECFELLEHPERWPEDPMVQAELAELLELHLALHAHASELPDMGAKPIRIRGVRSNWLMAAAATLLVLVPSLYVVQHTRYLKAQARDRAHIEEVARRRSQDRLWSAFFQQSSELLKQFEKAPPVCDRDRENRTPERELALALLEASHQLASQGAPLPEAESTRTDLHAWLNELSMEDGCMDAQRAEELRRWAANHNLEDESQRLGRLLRGERN